MSSSIDADNIKPRCADCQHVQAEIYDLKNFVAYWFDIFARRFDDQDRNLAIIVQSIGERNLSPAAVATATSTAADEPSKDKNKTRNVWSFLENETANDSTTNFNAEQQIESSQNAKSSFASAVEVEQDEEETGVDVKPDINLLRQSLVTETNKLEIFSPSLGLKTDSTKSKVPNTATASETSPTASCAAAIQQRIKDIEQQMKNKQYILVREKADATGKTTVIERRNTLNVSKAINGPSVSAAASDPSEPKVAPTVIYPLPSTVLGTLFRRPLSEEAKRRLIISKPKPGRVTNISSGSNVSALRHPSEEAKRRLLQLAVQRHQTSVTGTDPPEMFKAKKRLSDTMTNNAKKKVKKHAPWSGSSESSAGGSASSVGGSADEESIPTNSNDKPSPLVDEKMRERKQVFRTCPICQKQFSNARNMQRHKKLHINRCELCDKRFIDADHLAKHVAVFHDEKIVVDEKVVKRCSVGNIVFKCRYCEETYGDKKTLNEHQSDHFRDGIRFKCRLCENSYNWYNNLVRHFKQSHDGRWE